MTTTNVARQSSAQDIVASAAHADQRPTDVARPARGGGDGSRSQLLMAVLLFVLAVILRLALVERHSLWGDEAFSLSTATGHSLEHPAAVTDPSKGDFADLPETLTPGELARYAKHEGPVDPANVIRAVRLSDTSPPLYYLLLAYWTNAFGTGDAGLRMFSVACSLAAFPLLWSLAGSLGGPRARVPVLLLYAIAPLSVYLSTEGRMYSLMWLTAAANLWATVRLTGEQRQRSLMLVLWVLTSIAGLYTHYFFTFIWAPTCVWMLVYPGHTRRLVVVAAAALALLAAAPWYVHLPADMRAWRVTEGWQKSAPFAHHPVVAIVRLPFHFFTNNGTWAVRPRWEALNLLAYAGLFVAACWYGGRRTMFAPRRLLLWAIAGSACLLLLGSDYARGTYAYANDRYVAAGLPAAMLLAGIALMQLGPRLRAVFLLLIVFCSLLGFRKMWINDGRQMNPVREMAAALRQASTPDDLVLIHAIPSAAVNLARYLESPDGSHVDAGLTPSLPDGLPRVATWVGQLGQQTVPDDIARLVAGRRRVIFVQYHDFGAPPVERAWLDANGREARAFKVGKIPAVVYSPRDGATTF